MEDTLKERLRKMWRDNDGNPEKAMQAAYNLALSERWVDVRDRLPEDGQIVIALYGLSYKFCQFRDGKFYRHVDAIHTDRLTSVYYDKVTHWQSLPTPPQTKD